MLKEENASIVAILENKNNTISESTANENETK